MSPPRDLSHQGKRYAHLLVIEPTRKDGKAAWLCICDCGSDHVVKNDAIKKSKSCGRCSYAKEIISRKTHGLLGTSEYSSWSSMRTRCNNSKSKDFKNYGARGINVCQRWDSFENFISDMGPRPEGTSIERKDVNGNYTPDNCRWATSTEQARNRRSNRILDTESGLVTLSEASDLCGKSSEVLAWRMGAMGMTATDAMNTPMMRNRSSN